MLVSPWTKNGLLTGLEQTVLAFAAIMAVSTEAQKVLWYDNTDHKWPGTLSAQIADCHMLLSTGIA